MPSIGPTMTVPGTMNWLCATSRLEGHPGRSYFAAPVGLKTLLGVLCLRTWLISGVPHAAADLFSFQPSSLYATFKSHLTRLSTTLRISFAFNHPATRHTVKTLLIGYHYHPADVINVTSICAKTATSTSRLLAHLLAKLKQAPFASLDIHQLVAGAQQGLGVPLTAD
ncbi:hypothetical protein BDR05DRAFT_1002801 [Suillus weaverae]|nr:hypothetical protein BDR05DRAFT_1002801 [Suillus weaverae]